MLDVGDDFPVEALPEAPTLSAEAHRVLKEARALIKRGWCRRAHQRWFKGFFGFGAHFEYCIIGATRQASGKRALAHAEANAALTATLQAEPAYRRFQLPEFNDSYATKRTVLALFDRTLAQ